jgi:AraC-like DNA-binding protein
MEIACIMIREGRLPVHKIALSCGYSSYGGFLSAFKKYTGHSPEEYRKIAVSADCDAPLSDG